MNKELNISRGRDFILNVYALLKNSYINSDLAYDPGQQKDINLNKADLLLDAWRYYFKRLYPKLSLRYKSNTRKVINIIFANELFDLSMELFKNTAFTKLAFYNLKLKADEYYNTDINV